MFIRYTSNFLKMLLKNVKIQKNLIYFKHLNILIALKKVHIQNSSYIN
jgi:hypothetical protein